MQSPNFNHRILNFEEFTLLNEGKATIPPDRPQYTGRYFGILREKTSPSALSRLFQTQMGLQLASTSDFAGPVTEAERMGIDALYYEQLGVVLLDNQPGPARLLAEATSQVVLQPERIFYVPEEAIEPLAVPATWGIKAIKADVSAYSGKGVRVAVLDSGFNANHADFFGRQITSKSFVPNEATTQDARGHGTHCIGTACGRHDGQATRYGVAGGSEIYVGKVFNQQGATAGSWILDAIEWAVANQCRVVSMSFGASVLPNQSPDRVYELAARNALQRNCILVAAAGNNSSRSMQITAPVNSPANCPSILAVAAVDAQDAVADFSCMGINPNQDIDIAAPGVGVYSSWVPATGKPLYRTISGTSMATPHVAGVLAMLWEKNPNFTAPQIVAELRKLARPLAAAAADVGVGLVQAP
jgi:subtilisin family serine protease